MAKRYNLNQSDRDKLAEKLATDDARKKKVAVRQQTPRHHHGGIPCLNSSGESIPPFAVMQCDEAELERERPVAVVVKPASGGKLFLFNGPRAIAEGDYGIGYREGRALFGGTSVLPALWSPVAGEWELSPGGAHFRLVGTLDAETHFFLLVGAEYDRIKGTLVGAMGTGDSTWTIDNIEVLSGADPRTDSTSTTEVITISNADHAWEGDDNAVARAEWNATLARWEFYQVTCPA